MLSKTFTISKQQSSNEPETKMDNLSDCQMNESESAKPSDTEVPEKYKDLFKKKLVVNLIRYDNIEETFNSSTLKPNT